MSQTEKDRSVYDKKSVYQHKIRPLLKELLLICNDNSIPVFIDMAIANDKDGTTYETEFHSSGSYGIYLHDDVLYKYALVKNGFSVYPGHNRPYLEEALSQYLEEGDTDDITDITEDAEDKEEGADMPKENGEEETERP